MMFDFLKRKKKDKQKEEGKQEYIETPQNTRNGIARGMYCPSCGYMEVNEDSNALPMEGFAICPNCGDLLKMQWFMKVEDGYRLAENATPIALSNSKVSGGHYRVRKPGPNRTRRKGKITH